MNREPAYMPAFVGLILALLLGATVLVLTVRMERLEQRLRSLETEHEGGGA